MISRDPLSPTPCLDIYNGPDAASSMPPESSPSRNDLLARSIDEKGTFFQFGYQLCLLETAAETAHGPPPMAVRDIKRILSALAQTASRSNLLEPFCKEIEDVLAMLDERTKEEDPISRELRRLIAGCARRWLGRVKDMPRGNNALAMDITFSLEMAGYGDIASDLFESIVCMENGAFRASGMMSVLAMEKALRAAGAPKGTPLEIQLGWAKRVGRLTAADQRCANASLRPGRTGDWDQTSAEGAVQSAVRLAKKVLSKELEQAMLEAANSFCERRRPHGTSPVPFPHP
jgi:hypothetical protein